MFKEISKNPELSRRDFFERIFSKETSKEIIALGLIPVQFKNFFIKIAAEALNRKEPVREIVEKTVEESIEKLSPYINQYSEELGVDSRIVGGIIYVESLRYFTTEKGFIEAKLNSSSFTKELLKLYGATYGVGQMSSDEQRRCIENFNNPNTSFYMGKQFENYLSEDDFKKVQEGEETVSDLGIISRDYKHPDIQVKFIASFVAQIQKQWGKAGHNISNRPDVLATLYNLGFDKSKPKANPKAGGSKNYIFGKTINFGEAVQQWHDTSNLNPGVGGLDSKK